MTLLHRPKARSWVGHPLLPGTHPVPDGTGPQLPSTARGRREGRGWELGGSQPLILAQETEERLMAMSVQTLRTAHVCSESDGGRGLVKPSQRLSQLFLPRHTDPCGESRPWLPGAHWEIRPTSEWNPGNVPLGSFVSPPNQEEMRNQNCGGKTNIIPSAEPRAITQGVTVLTVVDGTVLDSDSP